MGDGRPQPRIATRHPDAERLSDGWDALAKELGLTGVELAERLDAGTVQDAHWPAILKAEKLALRHIEEATPM